MDLDLDHELEPMEEDDEEQAEDEGQGDGKVYLPGTKLNEGEELECDESAYVMLHEASTGAPCLSFDIICEGTATTQDQYPISAHVVAGTQAAKTHTNSLIVMKMSNMHKTQREGGDDDDGSDSEVDDEEDGQKPQMSCALIKHQGSINRVRCTNLRNSVFAATWSEMGRVNIYDLKDQLQAVESAATLKEYERSNGADTTRPTFSFNGHQKEGFALAWSDVMRGYLATGDCRKDIHIWKPSESTWMVDQHPLVGHQQSVEDLQWSPNEENVLASCSVDRSIRVWDIRAAPSKACMLTAADVHQSDINVISWNKNEPLIVSGGDDGVLHIWDLRYFQNATPIATFKHHKDHVTTVEWHPTDSTVFASGGDDDQIVLWDVSVEKDDTDEALEPELKDLPPQLLFIHQGQKEIKELHWHPRLPGVIFSTAHSGFNVFKTISV